MSVRVMVPAAAESNSKRGWAVLSGTVHPPEVIAFCWDRERASEVLQALRTTTVKSEFYLAPAILDEDNS